MAATKTINAKEAKRAAEKRATEIKNQREAADRKARNKAAKEWLLERAAHEKNQIEWITGRIKEAISKGQQSTHTHLISNDDRECSGKKYFWETTPFKPEMKRVIKHFEDLGYVLEIYVHNRENVDLGDINPRDNWITYETNLKISW